MKRSLAPIKIHPLFEKMEIDNSLFELKYKNKIAIWDICRREVFVEINRILLNKPKIFSHEIKPIDKYKDVLKKIYNKIILNLLRFKKGRILVITFRRFKKKDKKYDFVIDPITNKLNDCFYLDFANPSLRMALFRRDSSFLSFKVIRKSYNDIENISKFIDDCIFKSFKINFYSKDIINYCLNNFISGGAFFEKFIENLKCQRVIYSDNGSLKYIPYVCKIKKITCFEVQHGGSPGSIMWTYPKKKEVLLDKNNCYYPDYFFLWGECWRSFIKLPSKFKVIGTYYHTEKIDHSDKILFITNKSNYTDFNIIAKEVAIALPNRKILFKLHPEQFDDFSTVKLYFETERNVEVITNQINNKILLSHSSDFVTLRSSLAYQALQSGCRGHILKKDNYYWDEQLLKFTKQFSNSSELLINLKKKSQQNSPPVFYEKIRMNVIRNCL